MLPPPAVRMHMAALQAQHGRSDRRVEFMHLDLSRHMLWPVDLVIVRDVLMHFSDVRQYHAKASGFNGQLYYLANGNDR